MNANKEQIRQLAKDANGYSRWSTQSPIERDGNSYLVTTQWYERNRVPFLEWMKRYKNA